MLVLRGESNNFSKEEAVTYASLRLHQRKQYSLKVQNPVYNQL